LLREAVLIGLLMAEHRVARQTAGKALTLLEVKGLVLRLPGTGTRSDGSAGKGEER